MNRIWLIGALVFASACDDETAFFRQPPPVDGGVVNADAAPAMQVDASVPDAGFMDAAEPPPAAESVYIQTGTTLYTYDPMTNTAAAVGNFMTADGPIERMVDIAIDLQGRMFGGTSDKKIFSIDPETAFCRYRFDFDDILHGLTFLADGRLVVAGERVSIIDPNQGTVLLEMVGAQNFQTSGDIVGLPDGKLYWTVRNTANREDGDGVVRIDPNTGRAEWISAASVTKIYGLGFAGNSLYGFSDEGVVVEIDPSNGRVLSRKPLQGRWWGATTNPVLWQ